MFQQARSSRVRLLCAHIFCFIFVFGTQAFGQITPNIRAIDRAVSTNIDQALTRHPVELAIEQSSGSVIALDFDESSSYLLTLHEDGQIISWDLETGRPLTRFERLSDQVFALKFLGGNAFVSVTRNGLVSLWNQRSSLPSDTYNTGVSGVQTVSVSADRRYVGLLNDTAHLALVDLVTDSQNRVSLRRLENIIAFDIDLNSELIATLSGDGLVQVFELQSGILQASRAFEPVGDIVTMTFLGAQGGVGLLSRKGQLQSWNWEQDQVRIFGSCGSDQCQMRTAIVNASKSVLYALDENGALTEWIFGRTGATVRIIGSVQAGPNPVFVTGSEGQILAIRDKDGFVIVKNPQSEEEVRLVVTDQSWGAVDSSGRFDGPIRDLESIRWRAEEFEIPIVNFSDDYYEPGLVRKIIGIDDSDFLTDPRSIQEGVLSPPRLSIEVLDDRDGRFISFKVTSVDTGGGLGEVLAYHQGLMLSGRSVVSDETRKVDDVEIREVTFRTRALAGGNRLTAFGENLEGVSGRPAETTVSTEIALEQPQLHVLTIGINEYDVSRLKLNYAVPDAVALGDSFKSGAASYYSAVNLTPVFDQKATKKTIVRELGDLEETNPQDTVVIYFAGHGHVYGSQFNYLTHKTRFPLRKRDINKNGLSIEEIGDFISRIGARRVLLLMDTCKSGDALATLTSHEQDQRLLHVFSNRLGIHLVAATAKGQLAAELEELGHGIFTYSILDALSGVADRSPADGFVSIDELISHVEGQVAELSENYTKSRQWATTYTQGLSFVLVGG